MSMDEDTDKVRPILSALGTPPTRLPTDEEWGLLKAVHTLFPDGLSKKVLLVELFRKYFQGQNDKRYYEEFKAATCEHVGISPEAFNKDFSVAQSALEGYK